MAELHNPTVIGPVDLDTLGQGTIGQTILSQGTGNQVIWGSALPLLLFAAGNKVSQVIATPADMSWNTPLALNGIVFTAPGIFTLIPGHTYLCQATVVPTSGGNNTNYQWVSHPSNTPVGSLYAGQNNTEHIHVYAILTPVSSIQVKIRVTGAGLTVGPNSVVGIQSYN